MYKKENTSYGLLGFIAIVLIGLSRLTIAIGDIDPSSTQRCVNLLSYYFTK